ncbi:MAG: (2Fe-2S)-binding protein [Methyloligellaceae bacterium]
MLKLKINGKSRPVEVQPDKPLLWVLREDAALTGSKFGCGVGACGACTVLIDGEAVRSCSYPVEEAVGKEVTTIEGLATEANLPAGELHPIQKAWINSQVPQCGYCQSGMIMATAALLKKKPNPTDEEINEAITNLCRCGTYPRVRQAIKSLNQGA